MLIPVNLPACPVLLTVQLPLFTLGQVPVVCSHIRLFLVLDVLLAILQMRSLTRCQRAVPLAIRDRFCWFSSRPFTSFTRGCPGSYVPGPAPEVLFCGCATAAPTNIKPPVARTKSDFLILFAMQNLTLASQFSFAILRPPITKGLVRPRRTEIGNPF
jgi:hypothetical protein